MFLQQWWWPLYAAIYPFLGWMVLTGSAPREDVLQWKIWGTVVFVVVGLALQWVQHPAMRLSNLVGSWRKWSAHPAALVAAVVGLWALLAAAFSPDPTVAFTGSLASLERYSDGALWALLLSWVFLLVYWQSMHNPLHVRRMAWGGLVGVLLVALAGGLELALERGLHYYNATLNELPLFTFPQQGHLAGVLALGAGLAGGLRAWWALALLALSVGLTVNRAALVALGMGAALMLRSGLRPALLSGVLLVSGMAVGWWITTQQSVQTVGAPERSLLGTRSSESRLLLWQAALGGIAERPITGWGGGHVFAGYWSNYLSDDKLNQFLQIENNVSLVGRERSPSGSVLVVRLPNDRLQIQVSGLWKSHNWFLDTALMYGLVGLLLILALLLFTLRAWWNGNPAAFGILVYSAFLMFWFPIVESEGLLWALWGAAVVMPKKG